ncbi:MAG: hypothetical protein ABR887_00030 [Methanoregulaceae archaeon]|jgi:hypothetical protein
MKGIEQHSHIAYSLGIPTRQVPASVYPLRVPCIEPLEANPNNIARKPTKRIIKPIIFIQLLKVMRKRNPVIIPETPTPIKPRLTIFYSHFNIKLMGALINLLMNRTAKFDRMALIFIKDRSI